MIGAARRVIFPGFEKTGLLVPYGSPLELGCWLETSKAAALAGCFVELRLDTTGATLYSNRKGGQRNFRDFFGNDRDRSKLRSWSYFQEALVRGEWPINAKAAAFIVWFVYYAQKSSEVYFRLSTFAYFCETCFIPASQLRQDEAEVLHRIYTELTERAGIVVPDASSPKTV